MARLVEHANKNRQDPAATFTAGIPRLDGVNLVDNAFVREGLSEHTSDPLLAQALHTVENSMDKWRQFCRTWTHKGFAAHLVSEHLLPKVHTFTWDTNGMALSVPLFSKSLVMSREESNNVRLASRENFFRAMTVTRLMLFY